jgi:hypothetical protein
MCDIDTLFDAAGGRTVLFGGPGALASEQSERETDDR